MYVILQSDFDKERRDRVAAHLQKYMAQSGMAVHRQDTQDVVEIAASAVRTIYEMNGAAEVIENPYFDIHRLLFRGRDEDDDFTFANCNVWLKVSKKKADEVLSRWNEQELLTAAIITARSDECSHESWPFEGLPHVIITIVEHRGEAFVRLMRRHTDGFSVVSDVAPKPLSETADIDEGIAFAAYRIFKTKLIEGFKE